MKIICIGEALIDMICTDKGTSLSNGQHFLKKPGGAPTNVAAAIAALGGEVELAAKVGDDPFGKQLVQVMLEFGVSAKWMITDPDYFTTFAFVSLMNDGERDFVFNRGADGQLQPEDVERIPLDDVGIVHFGSATAFLPGPLQTSYLLLLEKAIAKKIFVSFDPNYRQLLFGHQQQTFIDQSWHYLRNCQFFKVSDEEAMILTQTKLLEDAADNLRQHTSAAFAITLGKEGTLLRTGNSMIRVPTEPVEAVDTTGAGDAFAGAVLYQLAQYTPESMRSLSADDWKKLVVNGNKAGAKTCMYMGAMEAFKHLSRQIFD